RDEGGRRVGRATGHAARDRDVLAHLERTRGGPTGPLGQQPGRSQHDVVGPVRYGGGVDVVGDVGRQGEVDGVHQRHVVVDPDRVVDGVERVEAVVADPADAEVEVDLGGGADGDAHPVLAAARPSAI